MLIQPFYRPIRFLLDFTALSTGIFLRGSALHVANLQTQIAITSTVLREGVQGLA